MRALTCHTSFSILDGIFQTYYLENEEHPEASAEGGDGEEVADAKPVDNSQGHRRIKWNWVD